MPCRSMDALCPLVVAQREQTAVDARVQGLHATVHHLGEAGLVGDVLHLEARLAQRAGRAPGGEELHAAGGERPTQFGQAGLVVDREEGAANRDEVTHGA